MIFQLTDDLCQKIIRNLENQEEKFYFDAESLDFLPRSNFSACEKLINERFYLLPDWKSEDGFALMQDFVNLIDFPKAKSSLQSVLHSGRGVFKGFKKELKNYPQQERLWHSFKNKKMSEYVHLWYNGLREIWGLEKLEIKSDFFDDELNDLVYDDFYFQEYDFARDSDLIIKMFHESSFGLTNFPHALKEAAFDFWHHQFLYSKEGQNGFIVRSLSDDFAGCITFASSKNLTQTEKTCTVTSFFVLEKYLGLGIEKALLEMCIDFLKEHNFKWILLAYSFIPESVENLIEEFNFERTGIGFIAEI